MGFPTAATSDDDGHVSQPLRVHIFDKMSVMKNILLNVLFEKIRLNFPPTWCFPKVGVWSFWERMSSSFACGKRKFFPSADSKAKE